MHKIARVAAAVAALCLASPASADIVVITGVNNTGTENVTFADQAASSTIFGSTLGQTNNSSVTGTTASPGNLLLATGGDVQGSGSNLTSATLSQTDGSTFTRLVFDIDAASAGSVDILVNQLSFPDFQDTFTLDPNGHNFFTITAINGQAIQSVTLTGLFGATFSSISNVRFGPVAAAVPEPGTWAMMLLGFAGIGLATRRRKAAALA
jgi:hypothetical protein